MSLATAMGKFLSAKKSLTSLISFVQEIKSIVNRILTMLFNLYILKQFTLSYNYFVGNLTVSFIQHFTLKGEPRGKFATKTVLALGVLGS